MRVKDIVDLSNAMEAVLKRMDTLQETSAGEPFTVFPEVGQLQLRLKAICESTTEVEWFAKELANLGSAFESLIEEEVDL